MASEGISSLLKSFFVSGEAAKPRRPFRLPGFQLVWPLVQGHAATAQFPGWCAASHCRPTRWLPVGEPHSCFLGSWGYWLQMLWAQNKNNSLEKDIWLFIPKELQILPESPIGTHYVAQIRLKLLAYDYRREPRGLTRNLQLYVFHSIALQDWKANQASTQHHLHFGPNCPTGYNFFKNYMSICVYTHICISYMCVCACVKACAVFLTPIPSFCPW